MNKVLENFLRDYSAITATKEQLSWDQETMMPERGLSIRKAQLSYLNQTSYDILVDDSFEDALETFEASAQTEEDEAIARELNIIKDQKAGVPRDLIKSISDAQTEAVEIWRDARENNEFEVFAEHLQDMIDLKQEQAKHIDSDREPYEVLFEAYEPHISLDTVESLFDQLTTELPRRLKKVKEASTTIPSPFSGSFDTDTQRRVSEAVVTDLGLPTDASRLDISTHPFTVGNAFETRITTRIAEDDLTEALSSTIHEAGHGLYCLGVPDDEWWNPLGWERNMTIHESQSRFYENHVGGRKAFFEYLLPVLNRHFNGSFDDVKAEDAYQSVNQVKEHNYIRTEADELTYHLHVALRFELGRDLINGDLAAKDLPEAWDEKMESYLGITPPNLAKGCLQDIHWAQGSFGYFPTYTLGSLAAAQLNESMEADLDVDRAIRDERFEDILDWQRDHIHRHGRRFTTQRLLKQATGEELSVDAYMDHLDDNLDRIYDLTF